MLPARPRPIRPSSRGRRQTWPEPSTPTLGKPRVFPWVVLRSENGTFTSIDKEGRRRSEYSVPIAQPKRTRQESFVFAEEATENRLVNEIRGHLEHWRALPVGQAGVIRHPRDGAAVRPLAVGRDEARRSSVGSKPLGLPRNRRRTSRRSNNPHRPCPACRETGSGIGNDEACYRMQRTASWRERTCPPTARP